MLRFAAAVLAVAAIAPTPAEKGSPARLPRRRLPVASPAIVNNDVIWTHVAMAKVVR